MSRREDHERFTYRANFIGRLKKLHQCIVLARPVLRAGVGESRIAGTHVVGEIVAVPQDDDLEEAPADALLEIATGRDSYAQKELQVEEIHEKRALVVEHWDDGIDRQVARPWR